MSPAMVDYLLEVVLSLMVLAGAGFTLVGSIGLLRLDDVFQRMHAPTKATTLGVGLVLAASVLSNWLARNEVSLSEGLVVLLLFVTAPVSAYLVARVALRGRADVPADVPADVVPADVPSDVPKEADR